MTTFYSTDICDRSYPDSDGKPMADNTEQYRWIVIIKENLEILFASDPNAFIAGDLLWYPVRSRIILPVAPNVMVVFGRPKGKRSFYRQWQEQNIPPQVVFEILSKRNNAYEMERKLEYYDTYGVEEYYLYNPENFQLDGWQRQNGDLTKLWQMNNWVSPKLGIRFDTGGGELAIYRPDGERFLTSVELAQRVKETELLLEQERQRAEQMAAYLRSLGVDPDNLPSN